MKKKFRNYDITLYERFNQLRLAIYSSPQQAWTVKKMASFVNLSPSYVQSYIKKIFSYFVRGRFNKEQNGPGNTNAGSNGLPG